jgi:hypothetical protein
LIKTKIAIIFILGLNTQACETKTTWDALPKKVQEGFTKNVHNAKNVNWEENSDYYFANFTENGEKGLAVFNKADNQWIETSVALAQKDLSNDQLKILASYKNYNTKCLKKGTANDNTDIIQAFNGK